VVAELEAIATGWRTKTIDDLDLAWPGVRSGGFHVFLRLTSAVGFARGEVRDVGGALLEGAIVESSSVSWLQTSDAQGRYALPLPLATVTVGATQLAADAGSEPGAIFETVTLASEGERVDLDLQLQPVPPWVEEVTPADGALDVPVGVEPQVRFSEAVAEGSLTDQVELLRDDGADGVEVEVSLLLQDSLVTLVPAEPLLPQTLYEVRVSTGVLDLAGNTLASAASVSFTTGEVILPAEVDPSRVRLYAPDGAGLSRIEGLAGAMPAGALVWAENLVSSAETSSANALADGSFELQIPAVLGDRLILQVLIPGANQLLFELYPYLSADRSSAFIDNRGGEYETAEGLRLEVPAGAFGAPTWVSLSSRALVPPPVDAPTGLVPVVGFDLDFGGEPALKPLSVYLPAPGAQAGEYLLSRAVETLGRRGWMVHDLLRLEGGVLTNAEPQPVAQSGRVEAKSSRRPLASTRFQMPAAAAAAALGRPGDTGEGWVRPVPAPSAWRKIAGASSSVPRVSAAQLDTKTAAKLATGNGLPGLMLPGTYQAHRADVPFGWYAMPVPAAGSFAAFNFVFDVPLIAMVTSATRPFLPLGWVGLLTRSDQDAPVQVYDLRTGYRAYDDTLGAPLGPDLVELPSGLWGDTEPPVLVSGSPLRFFLIQTTGAGGRDLAPGISRGVFDSALQIEGDPGSATPEAAVRLLDLDTDDAEMTTATVAADGSFYLEETVVPGHRYVLAVGSKLRVSTWLELEFNEAISQSLAGIEVRDAAGKKIAVEIEPVGTYESLRLRPASGWKVGDYRLKLTEALADEYGNTWSSVLELPFEVESGEVVDTLELPSVQDVARMGDILVVAAREEGVRLIDASDPRTLRNYLPGSLGLTFAQGDAVRGVTVDPHGRIIVVGGGAANFGQLKIVDLQEIDPSSTDQSAAWRGSTIISDAPGLSNTGLRDGAPRSVAVLSNDQTSEWTVGETLPAGLTLTPAEPPAEGGRYALTITGQMTALRPVTLENLTRSSWRREDSDQAGAFSVTLEVEEGDEVRLLRNAGSWAYVTIDGVGLAVVDVAEVWGEDLSDPTIALQLIDYWGGFPAPAEVCDVTNPAPSFLPTGVAVLADPSNVQPVVVATLLPDYGLGLLGSSIASPETLVQLAGECGAVEGRAALNDMAMLPKFGFDLDGDGVIVTPENQAELSRRAGETLEVEESDYALLTHGDGWLLIVDVEDRANPELVGRIKLPGAATGVAVDRRTHRAYVAGFGAGIFVVDLFTAPVLEPEDRAAASDRVLETIEVVDEDTREVAVAPELGMVLAGGANRGLSALSVSPPELWVLGEGEDGWQPVAATAPFGVPNDEDEPEPGLIRLHLRLPGGLADSSGQLRLELVSLGPGGYEIRGAGEPADLPPTSYLDTEALVLERQADNPWEPGYSLFLSEPIVLVADLRASAKYELSEAEEDDCERCDLVAEEVYADLDEQQTSAKNELLTGHELGVRFPQNLRVELAELYSSLVLDEAEIEVASVPWGLSPSLRQEPTLNPSYGMGDVVPGTLLHSGEMTLTETDLALKSRGIDLAFTRTYRSQTLGNGPLGPGWDHGYNLRLRELPSGDVDFYDGRGRRERFEKQSDGELKAPAGRFVSLERSANGWILIGAHGTRTRFDRWGRLVEIADPLRTGDDVGNAIGFSYDQRSRLVEVRDTLDRPIELDYDEADRLTEIRDFTGREFRYFYDADGRLTDFETPAVETIESAGVAERLVTSYGYATLPGGFGSDLRARDDLASVTDPKGQEWQSLTYQDFDGDGRAEEVASQTWGAGTVNVSYDFGLGRAAVTDRRGHVCLYDHDDDGRVTRHEDPASAVWSYAYDSEGLLTQKTEPLGRVTATTYDTGGGRRGRGNALEVEITPDARGANGSSATLRTTYAYEDVTHQPIRIVAPRGRITEIERSPEGLPLAVTRAVGESEETTTRTTYNDHGQPTELTNANGHVIRYAYFTSGTSEGYLRQTTVDPGGLDLLTRYETDARGNVVATVDPRGVRHEQDWNALDWPVESRRAVTGSLDGAPPFGYVMRHRYDRNGNLAEKEIPFDNGDQWTSVRYEHGVLDELLRTESEITPGGEVAVQLFEYDANLNPIRATDAEGNVSETDYDARNLPTQMRSGLGAQALPAPIVETTAYDLERQMTQRTDGRGHVWTNTYDGYGRPREQSDPLGNRQESSFDDHHNPILSRALDTAGTLLAEREVVYDLLDRQTLSKRWLWAPGDLPAGSGTRPVSARAIETTTLWDAASNVVAVTDALGRTTQRRYDAAERLVEVEDPLGNRLEHDLDAAGNSTATRSLELDPQGGLHTVTTTASYDALGRRITSADAFGNTTRFLYDARSLKRGETDAEGYFTAWTYDGLNRKTREVQPEGIQIDYGHDKSSRLLSYRDALGNLTQWAYDAVDRRTSACYPDGYCETFGYDAASNLTQRIDQRGATVVTSYDAANRPTARSITPQAGQSLEGPLAESFQYDGLNRLKTADSGGVVSQLSYDSLSRRVGDTTNGYTLTYEHDDVGNVIRTTYPSGEIVERTIDPLDRPAAIRYGGSPETLASFGYRGPDLVQEKTLGANLTGTTTFDAAKRPLSETVLSPGGFKAFEESLAWSPRNLKVAQSRGDLNEQGRAFAYDGAKRLLVDARQADPLAGVANNTSLGAASLSTQPSRESFSYDAAQNLLERQKVQGGIAEEIDLPVDPSGRNRPASVGGTALQWDANGNLVAKGDQQFRYDYRDRLTKVEDAQGNTIASYAYDAFNRRVKKVVGTEITDTVWDGWRSVEDYRNGQLSGRRVHGHGLDEAVRLETDLDGDGVLESNLIPLYDSTGNLALVTDEQGKPIERYRYSAYGERRIYADLTPPEVEQVRVVGDELWLEISEEVLESELQEALGADQLRLVETATTNTIALTVTQPIEEGRQAGRRLVLTPSTTPAEGTELELTIEPAALVDLFHNQPAATFQQTFTWPVGDAVLVDMAAPEVEAVRVKAGILEIELSEEADLASAAVAITLDSQTVTWTLASDRYTLIADTALAEGTHQLEISTSALDLDSQGLAQVFMASFEHSEAEPDQLVFEASEPREIASSAVDNRFGFHGLPRDSETGLLYVRNRYFDPAQGRFISADPLGFVDGPSVYGFATYSPINYADPLGLQWWNPLSWFASETDAEEKAATIKVEAHLPPIYVRIQPIRSSAEWTKGEIEVQLRVADRILGEKAGVHILWANIQEDPDPKESLTDREETNLLRSAAREYSEGSYSGVPVFYVKESAENSDEGGSALSPRNPESRLRSAIVNRYWKGRKTNEYITAHELGHAVGALCDPGEIFRADCRSGAPKPRYGGLMFYPSSNPAIRSQGEDLSKGEISRLRKYARGIAVGTTGSNP